MKIRKTFELTDDETLQLILDNLLVENKVVIDKSGCIVWTWVGDNKKLQRLLRESKPL